MASGNGEDHSASAAGRLVHTQFAAHRGDNTDSERLFDQCPAHPPRLTAQRKLENDGQSPAGRVLKTKVTTEQSHETRRHVQTKVGPTLFTETLPSLEDRCSSGQRDARTTIDDEELDRVTRYASRDAHGPIAWTEPTRVTYDNADSSFRQFRIRRELREVVRDVNVDRSTALVSGRQRLVQ